MYGEGAGVKGIGEGVVVKGVSVAGVNSRCNWCKGGSKCKGNSTAVKAKGV